MAKKPKRRPRITVSSTATSTTRPPASTGRSKAILFCPGVGTLVLPWWPEEVERSNIGRTWDEIERPGRKPLLVSNGQLLEEHNLGFQVRRTNVPAWLATLEAIAGSKIPVSLVMAAQDRGLFQITSASVVELEHDTKGQPTVIDVSMTLKRASDATVTVGVIPRKRNKKNAKDND